MKRPERKSCHQEEEDHVKLLKHMQFSINSQAKLGITNLVSFGQLCEEFCCCLYEMKLLEEGIYVSSCLRKFQLVEDPSMILNVIPAFEAFWLSGLLRFKQLEAFQQKYKNRNNTNKDQYKNSIKTPFITRFQK
ncbi:hypothetical protein V8B55DRAFT_1438176 [Mucor lusitanicus]